jgi:hypothetical protein
MVLETTSSSDETFLAAIGLILAAAVPEIEMHLYCSRGAAGRNPTTR